MDEYEDVSGLSLEELLKENARAGAEMDKIRAYRRILTDEFDRKMSMKDIREKHGDDLDDAAVEQINAIVQASRMSSKTIVKEVEG